MKPFAYIVFLLCFVTLRAESSVSHLVEQLRTLPSIEGSAVYYGGAPGRFAILVPYFKAWATDQEIIAMLDDSSPIVRVMGYLCASERRGLKVESKLQAIESDTVMVDYFPFGCVGGKMAVGSIIVNIKRDQDYFLHGPKGPLESFVEPVTSDASEKNAKKPNKAPVPTVTSVTPAADAPVAPAATAAHL